MQKEEVFKKYLSYRKRALDYSNTDMNLQLDRDNQVYLAVIDLPVDSIIEGLTSRSLVLIFGLNTHIYQSDGTIILDLEKKKEIMDAMQSLLTSSDQVLDKMELVDECEFYDSKNIRVYLKTRQGIHFRELTMDCKEDKFMNMLINNILMKL